MVTACKIKTQTNRKESRHKKATTWYTAIDLGKEITNSKTFTQMSHLFRSILLEKAKCYIFFLPTKADEDIGVAVYWGAQ